MLFRMLVGDYVGEITFYAHDNFPSYIVSIRNIHMEYIEGGTIQKSFSVGVCAENALLDTLELVGKISHSELRIFLHNYNS